MKKILQSLNLKNFIFLLFAGCINAIGVTIFLAPVKLYDSGISGTSILLSQITPEYLTLSIFLLLLNIPLFLFGLKKQGITFTIYSLFTVAVYSVAAWLITDILPVDVSIASPLAGQDLLLCALFGGVISGIGGYSNAEKTVIYFVVNRFQIFRMKNIVHTIDPKAFVTISEVADVFKYND